MSSSMLIKASSFALAGCFVESRFGPTLGAGPTGLSPLYAATPLILLGVNFWALIHGLAVVGPARTKYMELAEKDGEKDVKERYGLPNLYAQGTSKHALAFNCVQRSHQHIFETLHLVTLGALVGAVSYPITAAAATLMYAVGRYAISMGYAASEGDASKRYSSGWARYMWWGVLANTLIGFLSCISIIVGKPVL